MTTCWSSVTQVYSDVITDRLHLSLYDDVTNILEEMSTAAQQLLTIVLLFLAF